MDPAEEDRFSFLPPVMVWGGSYSYPLVTACGQVQREDHLLLLQLAVVVNVAYRPDHIDFMGRELGVLECRRSLR